MREIFDNISMHVISFLENHIGVSNVDFTERLAVSEYMITKWQEDNVKLPEDLRAFLQISDGIQLSWKIKKNDHIMPFGMMNLNGLNEIKRIDDKKFHFAILGEPDQDDSSSDESCDDDDHDS